MLGSNIRHSVNTGSFYPIDPGALQEVVETALFTYVVPQELVEKKVRAMLVPFVPFDKADTLYASAYSSFVRRELDEIFLFSDPVLHKIDYVAFADQLEWEIPIGKMKLTHRLESIVNSDDAFKDILKIDNSKHQGELSLECQLPFVDLALGADRKIIPFMVGDTSPRLITKYISGFIDPNDLLICVSNISTDIPTAYAAEADKVVIKAILDLDMSYIENHAATLTAPNSVSLLCNLARLNEWKPLLVDYSIVPISDHREDATAGAATILFIEQ